MDYALIENGIVTNIIWLYPGNAKDFPSAVPMNDRPVAIGDMWDGTDFYRNGEKVLTKVEMVALEAKKAEEAYREGVQEA